MAFAISVEATFTAVGTLCFLYYLMGDGEMNPVLKRELIRLLLIIGVNLTVVVFAIWVAFDDNYISHNGFCKIN
jgi:hypothetical protein